MKQSQFLLLLLLFSLNLKAQDLKFEEKKLFVVKENKKEISKNVVIFEHASQSRKLFLFKTKLQVNTDGTPKSYHPDDIGGNEKAINIIGNGAAVYKKGEKNNLFLQGTENYYLAKQVFADFQKFNYEKFPDGYEITWSNVLYEDKSSGKSKPCIIKTGEFAGYYGSKTSLKHDLPEKLEECGCANQVNSLEVNGFVLPSGDNMFRQGNIDNGDLVVAYNSKNQKLAYAVAYDFGPGDKLGEGSVRLNMNLLGKVEEPKNSNETNKFSTPNEIHILILPNSRTYMVEKPFNNQNIQKRAKLLLKEMGLNNDEEIIKFITTNAPRLK